MLPEFSQFFLVIGMLLVEFVKDESTDFILLVLLISFGSITLITSVNLPIILSFVLRRFDLELYSVTCECNMQLHVSWKCVTCHSSLTLPDRRVFAALYL